MRRTFSRLAAAALLAFTANAAQATVSVQVDPGAYQGEWALDEGPGNTTFVTGAQTIDAEVGPNFIFVGGLGNFPINVQADGTVIVGPAGIGGLGTLDFNTVAVDVDPVDYGGEWIISRVTDNLSGNATVDLVPAVNYLLFVGGGNFARFNINVADDGTVSLINNFDAAQGGSASLTFNNKLVAVDPGSYAGSWQVPGIDPLVPVIQTDGPASVLLVPGVTYVLIPNQAGMDFPVTKPCSVTELDFGSFIFTVGCTGLEDGLAAHYPFDDGADPTADVVSGNDGDLLGDTAFAIQDLGGGAADIAPIAGNGDALEFDGDGDLVEVADDAALSIPRSLSVAAWVKLESFDNQDVVVSKEEPANPAKVNYFLALIGNKPQFNVSFLETQSSGVPRTVNIGSGQCNGNSCQAKGTSDFVSTSHPAGTWRHLVGTYEATTRTIRVYLDGVLEGEVIYDPAGTFGLSGDLRTNSDPVTIGRRAIQQF